MNELIPKNWVSDGNFGQPRACDATPPHFEKSCLGTSFMDESRPVTTIGID
ncbi:MAG: hypothetical protein ACR2NK_02310 [Mariniblastus sp.]